MLGTWIHSRVGCPYPWPNNIGISIAMNKKLLIECFPNNAGF